MRRTLAVLSVVTAVMVGPWSAGAFHERPKPHYVTVADNVFWERSPGLYVAPGEKIIWRFAPDAANAHTITSYDGQPFDSGPRTGGEFSIISDGTATPYRCTIHSTLLEDGACEGMCGAILEDLPPPPPPTISSPADGATLSDGAITLTGTTIEDTEVWIEVDGELLTYDLRTEGTQWWATTYLGNGTFTIGAFAHDEYDNLSERTTITLTVDDTTPPAKPMMTAPMPGSIQGAYFWVMADRINDHASAIVRVNGVDAAAMTPNTWTEWRALLHLEEGDYEIDVVVVDHAGNRSVPSTSAAITVDDTAPGGAITSPALPTVAHGPITIEGTASDDIAVNSIEVMLDRIDPGFSDRADATCSGCGGPQATWSATLDPRPGLYRISARITDAAGNLTIVRSPVVIVAT